MSIPWPVGNFGSWQACWSTHKTGSTKVFIQICSDHEWRCTKSVLNIKEGILIPQPFGEYFEHLINHHDFAIFHSGAGKTKAAAACQLAIVLGRPDAVINLGTCGGVEENLNLLDIVIAEKTVQYDCIVRFGEERQLFYEPMITHIDTSWVDLGSITTKLHRGTIATADHDLDHEWRKVLQSQQVLGADWESGAIAKVCELNKTRCLILRGVSDIPCERPSPEADIQALDYDRNTPLIMERLFEVVGQMRFGTERR
jgi:nucleoside phosphorylase